MIFLTIVNTCLILFLFYKRSGFYIEFKKERTFKKETLLSYKFILWKKTSEYSARGIYVLRFPVRNKKKVELQEEIERLCNSSDSNKRQSLKAKFSWLKTWEEVREFEKNYSVVDKIIVSNLVSNFEAKK